jgi:hypothetical protein
LDAVNPYPIEKSIKTNRGAPQYREDFVNKKSIFLKLSIDI